MLKFRKATERESTLETIGTVATLAGKDGYHELASDKNFKSEKKVSLKLVDANGDYLYVNCSTPVSNWLRDSSSKEELNKKLNEVGTLPILKLPQTDQETGEPIMVTNEETGEEEQLILYSVSFSGATDMSATRINITEDMLNREIAKRAINFEDLIAI
jgi:hypothetical protein